MDDYDYLPTQLYIIFNTGLVYDCSADLADLDTKLGVIDTLVDMIKYNKPEKKAALRILKSAVDPYIDYDFDKWLNNWLDYNNADYAAYDAEKALRKLEDERDPHYIAVADDSFFDLDDDIIGDGDDQVKDFWYYTDDDPYSYRQHFGHYMPCDLSDDEIHYMKNEYQSSDF